MDAETKAVKEANLVPFKKGQSGNPKGKAKGQRSYATIYREALKKIGETQNMTPEEVEDLLHKSGLANALKGNFAFYKDALDRLHGQAKKSPDDPGSPDNPINHVHRVLWE